MGFRDRHEEVNAEEMGLSETRNDQWHGGEVGGQRQEDNGVQRRSPSGGEVG